MTDLKETLTQQSSALAQTANGFILWLADNPDLVGREKTALDKEFHRFATQANRLTKALQRPMCVGVFGPSQSGKSYLISALGRKEYHPLMARFGNREVDFIRDLNPEGGRESTGLVTRFTVHTAPDIPQEAPIRMRLLSQTDIVKIIGNTYFADCDHNDTELPSLEQLQETFDSCSALKQSQPVDNLTEEDVYDLQVYFERYFAGNQRVQLFKHNYWQRAAVLAPKLAIEQRARLFGLIWGEVTTFSDLYCRLYAGIQQLGFHDEAFTGLEALMPRDTSIIDVATLKGLDPDDDSSPLTLTTPAGNRVELPRGIVAALVAELQIVISDRPWDFFEHTDLLDFPGARSREQIKDVAAYLDNQNSLQSLFLRGKVAYLYERYCAEQELTSMLLCIGPGNQEVRSLPTMINDWIDSTHGSTPAQRSKQATSLFLVLTKFDMEFEEKAGETSPETRWTTRLHSSLVDFFGKQHDWPITWDEHGCFRNSYWLRNPNFKAKHIFDYDSEGLELSIRPGEQERITLFRDAFFNDQESKRFFKDPEKAWQEALRLNNGGVTYLAEQLRPICNPLLKQNQIKGQIEQLQNRLAEQMGNYYVSDNQEEEREKRTKAAKTVVQNVIECIKIQRFGELLSEFLIGSELVASIYYQLQTRIPDDSSQGVSTGAVVNGEDIWDGLGLKPAESSDQGDEATIHDEGKIFAKEVMDQWMQDLKLFSEDKSLCNYYRLPEPVMADLIRELIVGAQRLDLEEQIRTAFKKITAYQVQFNMIVMPVAKLTANILNSYVDFLGYNNIPLAKRPTLKTDSGTHPVFTPRPIPESGPVLGEKQSSQEKTFYTEWLKCYLDMVVKNVYFKEGTEINIQANQQLGTLLQRVDF